MSTPSVSLQVAAQDQLPNPIVVNLTAAECPIQSVVVYNDRAEITRLVEHDVVVGTHEFRVSLPALLLVDANSFRVQGGTGACTILEVTFSEKHDYVKWEGGEVGTLQKRLAELEEDQAALTSESARIEKQLALLENMERRALEAPPASAEAGPQVTPEALEAFERFVRLASARREALEEQHAQVGEQLTELRKQAGLVRADLQRACGPGEARLRRQVSVLLQASAPGRVALQLAYVVRGASWRAAYDLRVDADNVIHLTYYGLVQQTTGEDWRDVALSLSTATPSAGGAPPELSAQCVRFYVPPPPSFEWSAKLARKKKGGFDFSFGTARSAAAPPPSLGNAPSPAPPALEVQTAAVEAASQAATAVHFAIPRRATIASQARQHKITVALLRLEEARFKYRAVPARSLHAYLSAKVRNTSACPLLPGEAQVFFGNAFAAATRIAETVSPGEEFALALGVDPGLRIEHPPAARYREEAGLLARVQVVTYTQRTRITNNKRTEVRLVLEQQLPLSTEEKIRVRCLEPAEYLPAKSSEASGAGGASSLQDSVADAGGPERPPRLNRRNNLEWHLLLAPGAIVEIPFRYSIEWPRDREITVQTA